MSAQPLWAPDAARVRGARLTEFSNRVSRKYGLDLTGYADLHAWSVAVPEAFWCEVWDFCEVSGDRGSAPFLEDGERFPGR